MNEETDAVIAHAHEKTVKIVKENVPDRESAEEGKKLFEKIPKTSSKFIF